jgi:hypothetical protein
MDMEGIGGISRKGNRLDLELEDSKLLERGWRWVEKLEELDHLCNRLRREFMCDVW